MQRARKLKKPPLDYLFTDVYDEPSIRLQQQRAELKEHLSKYGQQYPIDSYEPGENL